MKNTPVAEIMSKNLVTVGKDQILLDVKDIFETHHLRHVPVVDGRKLVGIISLLDFMRLSFGDSQDAEAEEINDNIYKNVKVEKVMTENPMTLNPGSTLKEAAELFDLNMFHSVPVVEDGDLVGIITTIDLIHKLLEEID